MSKKSVFCKGICLLGAFGIWTVLIQRIDVRILGETQTQVGFAALNSWFHALTGVHMTLYTITDWLGLIPVCGCMGFGGLGLYQLIRRKSLRKVDFDILILGIYYVIVILGYLIFEMIPVNYRPVLIEGVAEASYPSSTTLLMLIVLPLYSKTAAEAVHSVDLLRYTETTVLNRMVYWGLFVFLMLLGTVKMILTVYKAEKVQKSVTVISMVVSAAAVLFLALAREPYAVTVIFLLFVIKGVLILKMNR